MALVTASGGGGKEVARAQDFVAVVRDWHAFAVVMMMIRRKMTAIREAEDR